MFISESSDGFIFDYKLYRRGAPADAVKLTESLERQQAFQIDQPIEEVVGGPGLSDQSDRPRIGRSRNHRLELPEGSRRTQTADGRSPFPPKPRSGRGSTEARIAILKNNGGGRVLPGERLRQPGHRCRLGACLSHNLWWIARKIRERREGRGIESGLSEPPARETGQPTNPPGRARGRRMHGNNDRTPVDLQNCVASGISGPRPPRIEGNQTKHRGSYQIIRKLIFQRLFRTISG